ncbi:MAG TPA: class I SAM-dependent methyltransferase [Casimicrobiaceae bacterium]|nr:class I SAM-dependent methyltransferase [Casimicrobiaceae bacterium]
MKDTEDALLAQQIEYYRERAPEYDAWWRREGRFDRGPQMREAWQADIAAAESALDAFLDAHAPRTALEIACGTGLWTQRLARRGIAVTAVDASPEVIELNRQRVASANVQYVVADVFAWQPRERYDLVFMSFWLSHVPHSRFATFWSKVAEATAPDGWAYLIDSAHDPTSHARDHPVADRDAGVAVRKLADGRAYQIVKVFWEPASLQQRLADCGFEARISGTPRYFIHGWARPGSRLQS